MRDRDGVISMDEKDNNRNARESEMERKMLEFQLVRTIDLFISL